MKMRRFGIIAVLVLFFTGSVLLSCSKISEENFNKIQNGMTQAEVYTILGEPSESSSGSMVGISGTSAKWSKDGTEISIQFLNGKVRMKNFAKISQKS
ncbi:MAG: outer membrane protein assembly factor BamE [Desulfococcaceae bacterium]|jgi:hypothetical protein|nr:outer membrane protein assembly factor BamE [Desulfococcaceae bacterium]